MRNAISPATATKMTLKRNPGLINALFMSGADSWFHMEVFHA